MKALLMAAGVGKRLGGGSQQPPKCLLEIGGKTLLQRHLEILDEADVDEVVIGIGYRQRDIATAVAQYAPTTPVTAVYNPDYEQGSIVTLWYLREHLSEDVLLMDADVLYDYRLLERLLASPHPNCFLLDRTLEPGDEPVKLCIRDGRIVEFRKRVSVEADYQGESVGFFRFGNDVAHRLAEITEFYILNEQTDRPHEEALCDVLLSDPDGFGFEDITGLPWIEIDFQEDVHRARDEILPRLQARPSRAPTRYHTV